MGFKRIEYALIILVIDCSDVGRSYAYYGSKRSECALIVMGVMMLGIRPLPQVVAGLCALIRNPDISTQELMAHIPGPDFPTGGRVGREAGGILRGKYKYKAGINQYHQKLRRASSPALPALRLWGPQRAGPGTSMGVRPRQPPPRWHAPAVVWPPPASPPRFNKDIADEGDADRGYAGRLQSAKVPTRVACLHWGCRGRGGRGPSPGGGV